MEWTALWVSLRLAFFTTLILTVVGIPMAWWVATSRRRWIFIVEAVIALPIVLPPTVLGFYMLMLTGPYSPVGSVWINATGVPIPFTFHGILAASVVFNLPFAVRPFIAGLSSVDRRLVEASWSLGVSRTATFCKIVVPMAWPGIITGMVLAFAHTLGEFGVVLMVGGNIPGVTQTLSILIYDEVQAMNYADAARISMIMLVFSFTMLCMIFSVQRRIMPV